MENGNKEKETRLERSLRLLEEEEGLIYVLGRDGKPLMPTARKRRIRRALKKGTASVAREVPFTVRLFDASGGETKPLVLGIDPGRTNVGLAVADAEGNCYLLAELETRNREIPRLMAERKRHRQASRRGERKRRQRRARKQGTAFADGTRLRKLPGCEKEIPEKWIRGSESRFLNRKHPAGWLTPTAGQLARTHVNLAEKIASILPIAEVSIEVNRFAFAELENPETTGLDFQNGPLKGFADPKEAVRELQKGKCLLCGKRAIGHYHHVVPRSLGGADVLSNLAGLCLECHDAVHKDAKAKERLLRKKEGQKKKYGGTSVLNQAVPYVIAGLSESRRDLHLTYGWKTCSAREKLGVVKDRDENPCHGLDAWLIALDASGAEPALPEGAGARQRFLKQFRKHDRARIKCEKARTYLADLGERTKGGKPKLTAVAKCRKPRTGQADDGGAGSGNGAPKAAAKPALSQWYGRRCREAGKKQAQKERSRLTVRKSAKSANDTGRLLPGAELIHGKRRLVLAGNQAKAYVYGVGEAPSDAVLAKECRVVRRNEGIVFVR